MSPKELIVHGQSHFFQPTDLVLQLPIDVQRTNVLHVGEGEKATEKREELVRLDRVELKVLRLLVDQLTLMTDEVFQQRFTLTLSTARSQEEHLIGHRSTNDVRMTEEKQIEQERAEERLGQQLFDTRGNQSDGQAEQLQTFATGQLTLIGLFVVIVVHLSVRLAKGLMDLLEGSFQFLFEGRLTVMTGQTPDQANQFDQVIVLQEGMLGNGIGLHVLNEQGTDALFNAHDERRVSVEELFQRGLKDGRTVGQLHLVVSENDEEAFENVECAEKDGFASVTVAALGQGRLSENVQHAGQTAGVKETNVKSFGAGRGTAIARDQVDQRALEVVEHLRRRRRKEKVLQTLTTLLAGQLLAGVRRRDETVIQSGRHLMIQRNEIENLTSRVAQTRVLLATAEITDLQQELTIVVTLRENLIRRD